jgi:hypothetical protein
MKKFFLEIMRETKNQELDADFKNLGGKSIENSLTALT